MAFVFYDVETTGLNRRFDQILQFAAIRTDVNLVETNRLETTSRLMPHVVPSPKALHITGTTLSDATDAKRQSHYAMISEIAKTLPQWCPGTFLGFNSVRFDEEFLRQAFYQCLHPIFLTNTNGNSRADALNLVRAAASLYPTVIRPGTEADGATSFRLGPVATANGVAVGKAHDATADVEATLALCRIVRLGIPELWSAFLRFSSKSAVLDFIREEEAFAYFDYFGRPTVMNFVTRIGVSPGDANAHYCLDLTSDIDALRKLDATSLVERLGQEPRPIRRLKANASPLLYPLWDIDPDRFGETSEQELSRIASSVRSDDEFTSALCHAAAAIEPAYPPSEHVELQIYGGGFFSNVDQELCRQFHTTPWDRKMELVSRFNDPRLKRLSRRLIFFENPAILESAERTQIAHDIAERRNGRGKYTSPPWTTISQAISELEMLGEDASSELKRGFMDLQ